MSLVPPYSIDLERISPPFAPGLVELPWLGPPAVAESNLWEMLPLAGTPSIELPDHVVEAVQDIAVRPGYPGTIGRRDLRAAIAARLSEEFGRHVNPDTEILITVGSMHALHLASTAICRGRRPAIAHAPSFFYKDIVAAAGGECVWVGGTDGAPDWDRMRERAGALKPSAVFACTPVNPTGYVFTADDLDGLARTAASADSWVISDEAYNGYLHDGRQHTSPATVPELADRTIVIRSFSKTYALGAWRVGFAAGPEPVISAMAKLLQYSVLGVPTIAQAAAFAALTGPQTWIHELRARVSAWRAPVLDAIIRTGILHASLPEAGTTIWASILNPELTERDVSELLGRSFGIPAVPGALFGATTPHVRIPFAGTMEKTPSLVQRLDKYASDTRSMA